MVNWRKGALVYVHSAVCETYLWCSGIPYIYGQLEGGLHPGDLRYIYILLYVKLTLV